MIVMMKNNNCNKHNFADTALHFHTWNMYRTLTFTHKNIVRKTQAQELRIKRDAQFPLGTGVHWRFSHNLPTIYRQLSRYDTATHTFFFSSLLLFRIIIAYRQQLACLPALPWLSLLCALLASLFEWKFSKENDNANQQPNHERCR